MFPEEQRVLTPDEYAALGYILYDDYTAPEGSYKTDSTFDLNFLDLAYRADTKEQYYQDFGYLLLRAATASVTGGVDVGVRTAFGILIDHLTD